MLFGGHTRFPYEGQRISSEAENKLKPIDALIDDTSFAAQVFANGLAVSALIATLFLALNFPEDALDTGPGERSNLIAILLIVPTIINIASAFGTMTNVARYQKRLEEFRTEYFL